MAIRNRIARAALRRLGPQFGSPHGPLGHVAGAIMRRRNRALNVAVVALAGIRPGDRVLDVGCGPGNALLEAADRVGRGQVHGVDASPAMVRLARRRLHRRANAHVHRGSAEALPLPDGGIDVAWAVNSLHHWSDLPAGLAELARALAPGGRALVVERFGPPTAPLRPGGLSAAQLTELVSRLGEAGFHVEVGEPFAVAHDRIVVLTLRPVVCPAPQAPPVVAVAARRPSVDR